MAIVVNGKVVNPNEAPPAPKPEPVQAQPVRSAPSQSIQTSSGPINPLTYVKAEARASFDPNKAYLVVDGKVKEISKKSSYLFDMITK